MPWLSGETANAPLSSASSPSTGKVGVNEEVAALRGDDPGRSEQVPVLRVCTERSAFVRTRPTGAARAHEGGTGKPRRWWVPVLMVLCVVGLSSLRSTEVVGVGYQRRLRWCSMCHAGPARSPNSD